MTKLVTNLALCLEVLFASGEKICITDVKHKVLLQEQLYYPVLLQHSFNFVKVVNQPDQPDDISFTIDSEFLSTSDVMEGKLYAAQIKVQLVDYVLNKSYFCKSYDVMEVIHDSSDKFFISMKPKSNKINNFLNQHFSPICRAEFCDERCKLNKKDFSVEGQIIKLIDTNTFKWLAKIKEHSYYIGGKFLLTNGVHCGQEFTILESMGQNLKINLPLQVKLKVGDQFIITAGCDKHLDTCRDKFSNVINFRGEPFIDDIAAKSLL